MGFEVEKQKKEDKILGHLREVSTLGIEAMQLSAHAKSNGKGIYFPKDGHFERVVVIEQKDQTICKMYPSQETSVALRGTFDELLATVNDELKQIPPWKRRIERFVEEYIPIYNGSETRLTTLARMLAQYSEEFVKGGFVDFHLFAPIRAVSMAGDLLKLDKNQIDRLIPDLIITDETQLITPKISEKHQQILDALSPTAKSEQSMFEFVMYGVLASTIVKEEFGVPSMRKAVPGMHARASILADRMIANMDSYFDKNREAFRESMSLGNSSLKSQLLKIPVTENHSKCTLGDVLETLMAVIHSEYSKEDALVAMDGINTLIESATNIVRNSEKRHDTLSGEQAQELRDVTNGLLAGMLFDVRFASLHTHPGYERARNRIIAGWQSTQYIDDVIDLPEDLKENGASMFKAFAREYDEFAGVEEYFATNSSNESLDKDALFALLQKLAPKTYRKLYELQQEKFKVVSVLAFEQLQAIPVPD